MKKYLLSTLLYVTAAIFLSTGTAHAEVILTASPTSAPADGTTAITLSIKDIWYQCTNFSQIPAGSPSRVWWGGTSHDVDCSNYAYTTGGPTQNLGPVITYDGQADYFNIRSTGTGNTLSAPWINMTTGNAGVATFTIKSSVAGTKTITLSTPGVSEQDVANTTVTFTSPPAAVTTPPAPQTSTNKSTSTVTSTPATPKPASPTPATVDIPAAPATASIKVGNEIVKNTDPITVQNDRPLVLSGKTVPNGVVTLTIHSTPKTVIVKADASGNWTYTVDSTGLESGKHTIFATVTDPVTNKTSTESTLMEFTLASAKSPAVAVAPKKDGSKKTLILVAAAVILVLAGTGWFIYRRHRAKLNVSRTF